VPIGTRTLAAQYRVLHARRCATSRALRGTRRGVPVGGALGGPRNAEPVISPVAFRSPACRHSFSDDWLRHARCGKPPTATAGSARPDTVTVSGHGPRSRRRSRTRPYRKTRGSVRDSDQGQQAAPGPDAATETGHRNRPRSPDTGPVTDQTAPEDQAQRQRELAAPGFDTVTVSGHGPRTRGRSRTKPTPSTTSSPQVRQITRTRQDWWRVVHSRCVENTS
jgi:hypothetical protein